MILADEIGLFNSFGVPRVGGGDPIKPYAPFTMS